nr:unnamed protein product [Digitaria exilis]
MFGSGLKHMPIYFGLPPALVGPRAIPLAPRLYGGEERRRGSSTASREEAGVETSGGRRCALLRLREPRSPEVRRGGEKAWLLPRPCHLRPLVAGSRRSRAAPSLGVGVEPRPPGEPPPLPHLPAPPDLLRCERTAPRGDGTQGPLGNTPARLLEAGVDRRADGEGGVGVGTGEASEYFFRGIKMGPRIPA